MANEIKLKRGSGSDPGASDLVVGEIAIRTDTGKLFTKKDDNSVAEISGGGIDDGDKGDITVSNSGGTFTIDNDVVTFAKMQNVSTSRLLGRTTSSSGDIEELTASAVRTLLNVADGATNVTNTNQLTNGAGFITATLTNEEVQDIVGGMVTGNTETGITVTYQDGDGTLDFVVGTLNQDTTGNAATATALETARTIAGVSFDGSANISLNNNAITNGAGYITSVSNSNVNSDAGIAISKLGVLTANTLIGRRVDNGTPQELTAAQVRTILNVADGATNVTNNNQLTNGAGYITTVADTTIAPSTIDMEDNEKILLGAGDDLQIFHDGTENQILAANGPLHTYSGANFEIRKGNSSTNEAMLKAIPDGAVELYHNNSKKAETVSGGFTITGTCTATSFSGDGSNLSNLPSSSDNTKLPLSGGELTGDLTCENITPDGNNTRELGSSSNRWSNVYTNDLHLSNKGGSNKIDKSWGDYTIQEGVEDLFLINNRNGKMYKFMLQEVS